MFNLTDAELSRTIWDKDLKKFELSADSTLSKEDFGKFVKFFNEKKSDVFQLCGTAAHYAFPIREYDYTKDNSAPGGYLMKNIRTIRQYSHLCHYYWTENANSEETTGLIDIFPNNCRPEINAEFWRYLLSYTESPYRSILDKIWIIRSSKKVTKGFPMGILWSKVDDTDVILLTHLLITSRLLTGWSLDIVYKRLLDMGFSKPNALVLSVLFEHDKQIVTGTRSFGDHFLSSEVTKAFTSVGPHTSDQPFGRGNDSGYYNNDLSNWDNFSPKRFAEGGFKRSTHYLLTDKKTQLKYTNQLWFGDKPVLTGRLGWLKQLPRERNDWGPSKYDLVLNEDAWNLYGQVVKGDPVDESIVKELDTRMLNDTPIDFNKKD